MLISLFHLLLFPSLEQQTNPSSHLTQNSSARQQALQMMAFSPMLLVKATSRQREDSPSQSFSYKLVQKIGFSPHITCVMVSDTFSAPLSPLPLPTVFTCLNVIHPSGPLKHHLFCTAFPGFLELRNLFLSERSLIVIVHIPMAFIRALLLTSLFSYELPEDRQVCLTSESPLTPSTVRAPRRRSITTC